MPLKCVICGQAHLPSERCGADTEAGLAASAKLDRARAALARVEASVAEEQSPAVQKAMGRFHAKLAELEVPVAKAAFKEAAIHGQAFVKDGRVLKREEVLAAPKAEGFDRNAYHKSYMKAYMRGWRARRRAAK